MDGLTKAKVLKQDSLMVIQQPVVHWYSRSKVDSVVVTISDSPEFLLDAIARYINKKQFVKL